MRCSGLIGFADRTATVPGIAEDVITEVPYLGDVAQRTEAFALAGSVLPSYRTSTSVSVLARGVEKTNYADIRYVTYGGVHWMVASAVMQWPRLVLYLGEEYHGPTPPAPNTP